MAQVEIFKTNVDDEHTALKALQMLQDALPGCEINFDLDDCDRVLRIKGEAFDVGLVLEKMKWLGHQCGLLP